MKTFSNVKKVIMLIDTETINLQGNIYDFGYVICDKKGEIFCERNWLVKEVFSNSEKMKTAYYGSKMFGFYADLLHSGNLKMLHWLTIVDAMNQDFLDYGVNVLSAYNLPFDMRVMRQMQSMLKGKFPILPKCSKLDLYRFACLVKLNTPTYKRLASEQNWKTEKGNFLTNAETAFKYCTQDFDFVEQHTALDDARIESKILASCYAAKKHIPYNYLRANQWKIVNS